MKKLMILFLFTYLSANAQHSAFIKTVKDDMTGDSSYQMKNPISNTADKFSIAMYRFNLEKKVKSISLHIQDLNIKCIDEGSKILFLFSDSSRLTLANASEFNCKSESTVYFGGIFGLEADALVTLQTKKILKIRVYGHEYANHTVTLTDEQANNLMNSFKYITD